MNKYLKCKRLKRLNSCAYHGSLVAMSDAAVKRDAEAYLAAYESALEAALVRETFALTPGALKRDLAARVALVEEVHKRFDKAFAPKEKGLIVYRDPSDTSMDDFERVLTEVVEENAVFDPLLVEQAYADASFGLDAQLLHPFGETVNADLTEFTPVNGVQAYVVNEMVKAVVDQQNIVKVDRGIRPDPAQQIAERTGKEIHTINGHRATDSFPEDYPDDLRESAAQRLDADADVYLHVFNEGWLYAFYRAVETAKNPERFASIPEDSNAARSAAVIALVRDEHKYWDEQWRLFGEPENAPSKQRAFFDGAVTAWDRWLEDLAMGH